MSMKAQYCEPASDVSHGSSKLSFRNLKGFKRSRAAAAGLRFSNRDSVTEDSESAIITPQLPEIWSPTVEMTPSIGSGCGCRLRSKTEPRSLFNVMSVPPLMGCERTELESVYDVSESLDDDFKTPYLSAQTLVTLHTNFNRYPNKLREQDMVNCTNPYDPIAGTIIKDEDVIVKASYSDFASTFRFSYEKVSNLNLNKEEKLIKVLNGFKPKSKLYLQGNGVQVISPVGQKGTQKLTFGSHTVYQLNESGTILSVKTFGAAPESKKFLVFFEKEENQEILRELFEIEVHEYKSSFRLACNLEPPKLTRCTDGYLIDVEGREVMTAYIETEEEWEELLAHWERDPKFYQAMKVNLDLKHFRPIFFQNVTTCHFVETLQLQVKERTLYSFVIPFVEKFPLLKKLQISGRMKSFSILKSFFRPSDSSTDQPNVLSHLSQVMTNRSSSCFKFQHLHTLTVSDLQIKFKSCEEIADFRGNVDNISFSREKFKLEMTDCSISIAADTNATLKFLLLLTCETNEPTVKELLEISAVNEQEISKIHHLSTTFLKGTVTEMKIATTIRANSLKDVLRLCKSWKLRKTDSFHFEGLSLTYNEVEFSWVLLLNNINIRDIFSFTHLQYFEFNRENMRGILEVISDIELEEVPMTTSIRKIVVEVELSDSRGEVCKLVTSLVECLRKFSIEIRTLKIKIECDDSGWGFFKFNLTEMKTKLKFDDVTITFPWNSTDDTRLVSVEVHRFPTNLIKEMNFKKGTNTAVSPLVCIDQKMDTPFLQPVSVFFPYPEKSIGGKIKVRVFSKVPPNKWQWQQVHDDMIICAISRYRKKKLCYQSTHFSPVVSLFDSGDSSSSPSDFTTPYFADSVFVTIHPLVTRKRNVVFDCVDEKDDDKHATLKLSDYFEKRKVGQMKKDENILAYFDDNLVVEAPKLEHGDKMLFCCPEQERIRNKQEYKMKKIGDNGDWSGFIHYYLKSGEEEKKLFHMGYHIPIESVKSTVNNHNQNDTKLTFQQNTGDKKTVCLEKAMFKLCRDLQNSTLICMFMISEGEMTTPESDEILCETIKVETNKKLIRNVMAHGSRAYDKFREALIELKEPKHLIEALPKFDDVVRSNSSDNSSISVSSLQTGEGIEEAGPSAS